MYKVLTVFISLLFPCLCFSVETAKPTVLISVAPYEYLIKGLAGDTLNVKVMVPKGASPHTYEPTPRDVMEASKADIWFQIGEGFEAMSTPALKSSNPKLEIVDLQKGLNLIRPEPGMMQCCPHHHGADPHFWMSPVLMKKQAATIAKVLSKRYPENQELYAKNLVTLESNLDSVHHDLETLLGKMPQKTIMVSHPSYSYLARDYGFTLLSLESEGRDPTPMQVTKIIEEARQKKVKVIYIQEELNTKGAKLVAQIIGAKVVTLDPYRPDFADNLREIATHFAQED